MNGTNPQEDLQAKAEELWLIEPDPDPRSARYAEADRNSAHRAASRPTTAKRPANWVSALYGYEDHWRENGRTPRERTRNLATLPAEERRRGEWARYQRRFEDKLCRYQLLRLDVSPAFEWDPQDHGWQENFDACVQHVDLTGKLPYLNGADTVEFALARWLGRQLRQLQMGTQSASRAAQLAVLMALQNTGSGLRHPRGERATR